MTTMPTYRDCYLEEVDGKYIEKPLLVTISLEEYRSLVQEVSMFQERIKYLENRLLEETPKAMRRGADNG
jgi:hypothetical protein